MRNKRGTLFGDNWVVFLVLGLIIALYLIGNGGISNIIPEKGFAEAFDAAEITFVDAWGSENYGFLSYIFGGIPGYLVELTNEFSAAIIVIGIWFLFLLTFGDIMYMFGMFSKNVGWLVAFILTIIIANIKLIKVVSIFALTITAGLGALSVVVSILFIFILFIAFHFGTSSFREKIILRRAQDSALRSVAGGKAIASGATVLADVAKAAGKAAKDAEKNR